ncbi:MAG: YceI family protein [Bacteroidota bacterium]|jgi:polyisoprenoid-binding protein YceI|nr:YceI family protein [Ignavibacteria bacterium]MCU7514515.1 YceI family protein [Ignavibacteria bacterium]MCU7522357.1 YceI family protein [Ignavibacteria bacterium]MCU7525947.1 YceI family protein [Ignavibacteria bacterium]HEX2960909.1 YceI family protein [Ignavibacteriales bacterium]
MVIGNKMASLLLGYFLISVSLYATEHDVDKAKKNQVKFTSDAKIETFDGTTDKIDGYIAWDGDDILNKNQLYFEVDLRTLDTGIGLRNRHMKEEYLETDKYPMTNFKGKLVKADKSSDGKLNVTAEGNMFIHGVTKPITIKGTLIPSDGGGYRVQSNFEVKLTDYNIPIPQLMFLKISEVMKLNLDFFTKKVK